MMSVESGASFDSMDIEEKIGHLFLPDNEIKENLLTKNICVK